MDEYYDESRVLMDDPLFTRLGLADVAIAKVRARGTIVLTSDLKLQLALQQRGLEALNFNHVRMMGWPS